MPSYGTEDYFFGTDDELSESGFTDYCNLNGFYAKGSDNYPNISLYFLNNLHKYNEYNSAQTFVDTVMEALFSYYNNDVVTLEKGETDIAGTSYYYSLGNHGGEDQNYYFAYYAAIKGDIVIVWAVNATQDNFWMADSLIKNAVTTVSGI